MLNIKGARDRLAQDVFPAFKKERDKLDRIDKWYRYDHDDPHRPRHATREYRDLSSRAQTPWLGLVVTSVAQALYVDGYRRADEPDNADAWGYWQANGMDGRQIAINRAAIAYGLSYATVLPGKDFTGQPMPVFRGISPRRGIAFYENPESDDWPIYFLHAEPAKIAGEPGWRLSLYDDEQIFRFHSDSTGGRFEYVTTDVHGVGAVCPVVRFANTLDLEGRADGEVEPFIPVAGRIDQTVFDRLVVQRFASWVVRTVAGMTPPESLDAETQNEWRLRNKLRLQVEDILVADDPDTKFGSLPATQLNGFIDAAKADIEALAAVSQTPAHELLGSIANLNAEALAAARASLTAKVEERQTSLGESYEQMLRCGALVMGDIEGARDTAAQVRWRDTSIRSLAQAADALGKLAQMLGVPVEMLWEKVPGFTQQDVDRAKALVEAGGGLEKLMQELLAGQTPPDAAG